jgi:hypothetical protein
LILFSKTTRRAARQYYGGFKKICRRSAAFTPLLQRGVANPR